MVPFRFINLNKKAFSERDLEANLFEARSASNPLRRLLSDLSNMSSSSMCRWLPASIIRGGTSKGVFFRSCDVPPRGKLRDELLMRVIGAGDAMQIDGLGGGISSTSKVAIVGPSEEDGSDVDYEFGQVGLGTRCIEWDQNVRYCVVFLLRGFACFVASLALLLV